MTLEDYKKEKLSLNDFAIWKPTSHVFDIFKCSKCGYEEPGIYQYVISGHKVWQYPLSCLACNRNMLGVDVDRTGMVLGFDLAAKEFKKDKEDKHDQV